LDWQKTLKEIEDILIPHYQFDIYERGMYGFLLCLKKGADPSKLLWERAESGEVASCTGQADFAATVVKTM
jgi:hypothetical protein